MVDHNELESTEWYVIVRPDNNYPLTIYTDKNQAMFVAEANNSKIVAVQPVKSSRGKI